MKPTALLLVGAGGFAGAIARYVIGLAVTAKLGTGWPFGTFLINVSGCFLIGLISASLVGPIHPALTGTIPTDPPPADADPAAADMPADPAAS